MPTISESQVCRECDPESSCDGLCNWLAGRYLKHHKGGCTPTTRLATVRPGVRAMLFGAAPQWRIDYQLVTPALAERIRGATIFPEPKFSDHAPCLVEYAE